MDQFTQDFLAYCRARGDASYDFLSNSNCALAQFLHDTGRAERPYVIGWAKWRDDALGYGEYVDSPLTKYEEAPDVPSPLAGYPSTFPACADRLEHAIEILG